MGRLINCLLEKGPTTYLVFLSRQGRTAPFVLLAIVLLTDRQNFH